MLRKVYEFSNKACRELSDDVDLSDEDLFDMGMYNLDKETLLQPNSKLKNLFGEPVNSGEGEVGK